jgi:cytochrome c oxidase subunit 2
VQLQGGGTVVADEAYIRESIVNPQAKIVNGFLPIMPTFQGLVTEEQLLQLSAYVRSLGEVPAPAPAGAAPPQGPGKD